MARDDDANEMTFPGPRSYHFPLARLLHGVGCIDQRFLRRSVATFLLVPDQDRLDRIHRSDIMPFATVSGLVRQSTVAMVACNDPVLCQHPPTVAKTDCSWFATDGICKQATGAPIAVGIKCSGVHGKNAEAPKRGLDWRRSFHVARVEVLGFVLVGIGFV